MTIHIDPTALVLSLTVHHGNIAATARALGVSYAAVYGHLARADMLPLAALMRGTLPAAASQPRQPRGRYRGADDPRLPLTLSPALEAWRSLLSPDDRVIFDQRLALARPTAARIVGAFLSPPRSAASVDAAERRLRRSLDTMGIALPELRWPSREVYRAALSERDRVVHDALLDGGRVKAPKEVAAQLGVTRQMVEKIARRLLGEMERGKMGRARA